MFLGILGDYISGIFIEIKNLPLFVIFSKVALD